MTKKRTASLDRLQDAVGSPKFIPFARPSSIFQIAEERFSSERSILRCLSLARSKGCQTMVVEKIKPLGFLKDENEELKEQKCWTSEDIYRLSFFSEKIKTKRDLKQCSEEAFLGYAILKCDGENQAVAQWYVYEAVFKKYNHKHNCISRPATYEVGIAGNVFQLKGILYCQQNGLNKTCAHVAIRSILSRLGKDISYREMNRIAAMMVAPNPFSASNGLKPAQINAILSAQGLNVKAIDYDEQDKVDCGHDNARQTFPYQKVLYQGVESGMGVLLGFELDNGDGHIIPIYGHTFNKDTWITDAEAEYFKVARNGGYIPSEKWTSSFIGHDDNFGPCVCVPKFYLPDDKIKYVAEVLLDDVQYSGMKAEAIAFSLLQFFVERLAERTFWQKRLKREISLDFQNIVLRALCVEPRTYFNHLKSIVDWSGKRYNNELGEAAIKFHDVSRFWVVEFSFPQLFSSSERKLGEIVLDATRLIETGDFTKAAASVFLFARLPSACFVASENRTKDSWDTCESAIESHVPLIDLSAEGEHGAE